jgi:hypothetical protein
VRSQAIFALVDAMHPNKKFQGYSRLTNLRQHITTIHVLWGEQVAPIYFSNIRTNSSSSNRLQFSAIPCTSRSPGSETRLSAACRNPISKGEPIHAREGHSWKSALLRSAPLRSAEPELRHLSQPFFWMGSSSQNCRWRPEQAPGSAGSCRAEPSLGLTRLLLGRSGQEP